MIHGNLDNFAVVERDPIKNVVNNMKYHGQVRAAIEMAYAYADLFLLNILLIENGKKSQLVQPTKCYDPRSIISSIACLVHHPKVLLALPLA